MPTVSKRQTIPKSDGGLLEFSANLLSHVQTSPTAYALTTAIVDRYEGLHASYAAALAASDPNVRNRGTTIVKNAAKAQLLGELRDVVKHIDGAMPAVSEQLKSAIGLYDRRTPTPIGQPTRRPGVDLTGVVGRTVYARFFDPASASKRARYPRSLGVKAFVHVSPDGTYPTNPAEWEYVADFTDGKIVASFPESVPAGSQVFLCCAWYTARGETGPVSVPVSTFLQFGVVQKATAAKTKAA